MTAEFLTPPEVAKTLRCRESKVLLWIRSGRLPAINVSETSRPRYRIARAALDAFLESRLVSPDTRPPTRRQRRESQIPKYV